MNTLRTEKLDYHWPISRPLFLCHVFLKLLPVLGPYKKLASSPSFALAVRIISTLEKILQSVIVENYSGVSFRVTCLSQHIPCSCVSWLKLPPYSRMTPNVAISRGNCSMRYASNMLEYNVEHRNNDTRSCRRYPVWARKATKYASEPGVLSENKRASMR